MFIKVLVEYKFSSTIITTAILDSLKHVALKINMLIIWWWVSQLYFFFPSGSSVGFMLKMTAMTEKTSVHIQLYVQRQDTQSTIWPFLQTFTNLFRITQDLNSTNDFTTKKMQSWGDWEIWKKKRNRRCKRKHLFDLDTKSYKNWKAWEIKDNFISD